jgi:hypothetical protein
MNLPMPSRAVLRPSRLSMAAMLASLAAWLFPTFGILNKGFEQPARLDVTSFLILACWYLLIFMSFSIGEKTAKSLVFRSGPVTDRILSLDSNFIYYTLTLMTTIGTVATLVRIFSLLSIQQAFVFMVLGEANALKDALYEDYSVGLFSLRYVVLYSSSIALYRMIRWKSFSPINLFNIPLLFVSTFLLGSRLIFVATIVTTLLMLTFDKRVFKISLSKMIAVSVLLFVILSAVNSARNKDYYEHMGLSFAQAGISEIVAYLGSPFQVAIGSARFTDQLVAGGDQTYRNYADEEIVRNTNSAFVHLHEQMGYFSWLYVAGLCLFMGFLFEFLASLGKTIFLLPCGAILYASAELWRLDLFHQGLFIVWMVIGIGFPSLLIACRRFFGYGAGDPILHIPVA